MKALFSITLTDDGIKISFKEIHFLKDPGPILFTEEGIVTCTKDVQFLNVFSLISVKEEGNVIWTSDLQPQNALYPILVTDEGIVICFNKTQSWKASSPIFVTEEGIVISEIEQHFSNTDEKISWTDDPILTVFINKLGPNLFDIWSTPEIKIFRLSLGMYFSLTSDIVLNTFS